MKWSEYPLEMREKLRVLGAKSWEKNNQFHPEGINPEAYILGYTAAKVELTETPPITEQFLLSKGWERIGAMINGWDLPGRDFEMEIDFSENEMMIYWSNPHDGMHYSGKIPTEHQYEVLNQLLELHP
jgi:hypothetical protein